MPDTIHTDVAILGGGVSGLWILNVLRNRGYRALLLERQALGEGQTIASQGMIHGGIKYTLEGFTTDASETIAAMTNLWRDCLSGKGPIDLSEANLLSEDYFMFSDDSVTSRLTAFFGSRSLRGRISPLAPADFPEPFDHPAFKGKVYRLGDIVLDPASLLSALFRQANDQVFKAAANLVEDGGRHRLVLEDGTRLIANNYVLAAG
ncbi:MAG: FAD-dependent oxidoreductase, partial [Pseudomonadales bacterium]|nr:FAD-dependent oxidoreductase [Pseudomonadales bacterium]